MPHVLEIWRYPVSSLGGERLSSCSLSARGLHGDRGYLLVDARTGEVAAPEKLPRWRGALMFSACCRDGQVFVSSPDMHQMPLGADLNARISSLMSFDCAIVRAGDVLADCRAAPRYEAAPLHLMTTASLSWLSDQLPAAGIGAQRFRPNLVLETSSVEDGWIGAEWRCGDARGRITEPTKRCGMTMIAQPGLAEEPEILRTIVRQRRRMLGVYASVDNSGTISVGDEFTIS